MKDMLIGIVLGLLLGAMLASNYWLKVIPQDFNKLYTSQSAVIDKCLNLIGECHAH